MEEKELTSQQIAQKKWREKNRERIREYQRKYYQENKERLRELNCKYSSTWYEKNREKHREYQRKLYYKNKEKFRESARKWRKNNPDKWTKLCNEARKRKSDERKRNGEPYTWDYGKKREEKVARYNYRKLKSSLNLRRCEIGITLKRTKEGIIQIQYGINNHFKTLYHGYIEKTKQYLMWTLDKEGNKEFINNEEHLKEILQFIKDIEIVESEKEKWEKKQQ